MSSSRTRSSLALAARRRGVRDPVAGARLDQQGRVELRPQHGAELGRRDRLDAVHARHVDALGHRRERRRRRRPVEPRRTPCSPPRAISRPRAGTTDLYRGVYAYNHADWYVNEVLVARATSTARDRRRRLLARPDAGSLDAARRRLRRASERSSTAAETSPRAGAPVALAALAPTRRPTAALRPARARAAGAVQADRSAPPSALERRAAQAQSSTPRSRRSSTRAAGVRGGVVRPGRRRSSSRRHPIGRLRLPGRRRPGVVSASHTHHDYPAVDIAAPVGAPLYALADAVVLAPGRRRTRAAASASRFSAFDGQVWTYCHLSVLDAERRPGRRAHRRPGGRPRRLDRRRDRAAPPPPAAAGDRLAAAGALVPVVRRAGLHLVGRRGRACEPDAPRFSASRRAPLRAGLRGAVEAPAPVRGSVRALVPADMPRKGWREASGPSASLAALVRRRSAGTATLDLCGRLDADVARRPRPADRRPAAPPLVVPDVRSQAFVFAKGALEEAGFAWRVRAPCAATPRTSSSRSRRPRARV